MAHDPVSAVLDIGGKLIDRLWPNPAERDAAKLEMLKLQQSGELAGITGQLDINKIEAAHTNIWVSGWRPGVGWVCVAGLAYQFLIYPIAIAFIPAITQLDIGTLLTLLAGILGFGSMRTAEKINGVAAK